NFPHSRFPLPTRRAFTLDGRWAPAADMCASELLFPQPEEEI
ncbi:MAG: hypothetical protein H6Q34_1107, partial [Deltaproteobacteria bacterium]|nr:hypothetical protein [Deltaproteobacteria bacterium]